MEFHFTWPGNKTHCLFYPYLTEILFRYLQPLLCFKLVFKNTWTDVWHSFNLNQRGHFLFYIFPHRHKGSGVLLSSVWHFKRRALPLGFLLLSCTADHFFRFRHLEEIVALDLRVLLPDLFSSFSQNCCVFLKIVVKRDIS